METIGKRFEKLIKALNQSQTQFAKSINKPVNSINIIVSEKSKPGYDLLASILETYPDINPEWLMKGSGEMMRGMAKVSDGGGAALEEELRERIRLQNDTISALQYTVELQKQLLGKADLGKLKGIVTNGLLAFSHCQKEMTGSQLYFFGLSRWQVG